MPLLLTSLSERRERPCAQNFQGQSRTDERDFFLLSLWFTKNVVSSLQCGECNSRCNVSFFFFSCVAETGATAAVATAAARKRFAISGPGQPTSNALEISHSVSSLRPSWMKRKAREKPEHISREVQKMIYCKAGWERKGFLGPFNTKQTILCWNLIETILIADLPRSEFK